MSTLRDSVMKEGKLSCKENIGSNSQQKQTSHMIKKVMLHLSG
jgi:hypothetical protein